MVDIFRCDCLASWPAARIIPTHEKPRRKSMAVNASRIAGPLSGSNRRQDLGRAIACSEVVLVQENAHQAVYRFPVGFFLLVIVSKRLRSNFFKSVVFSYCGQLRWATSKCSFVSFLRTRMTRFFRACACPTS